VLEGSLMFGGGSKDLKANFVKNIIVINM
jgi:hypothetical protein